MPYLDHAATTPMIPEAVQAMTAHLGSTGNPSSLHAAGRRARRVVEESRELLAGAVGARPSEVIFTGGGTEADNLAVKGIYWSRHAADPARNRILVTGIEHHAVLDTVHWLAKHEGARIDWLPVDACGRLHPDDFRAAVATDPSSVALATVMWANNEVGTVLPVPELAAIADEFDVPIHADAVQALGQIPVDFGGANLDAMTVTGHKVGGPFGVGALILRRGLTPVPLLHGGGQERDLRSGTLDVPGIAAFAVAAGLATERRETFAARVGSLRDDLVRRVMEAVPDAVLNGAPPTTAFLRGMTPGETAESARQRRQPTRHREVNLSNQGISRLPGNAHFSFPGCEGDSLLLLLDAQGIECSTGSACSAGVAQPSHVLLAMGAEVARASGSLRFSLGHTSVQQDVDALIAAIGPVVERARSAGLASAPEPWSTSQRTSST